jgi:hypothetical protein
MTPALEAITEGLSRIDAAGFGKKLADAFVGGTTAMTGFQAAVDAFKTGNIEGALSLLWDSIKLQAKMTADEIHRNLVAAFQTAGTFIAEIFSPSGALLSTIASSFEMLGKKMASGIQRDLAGVMEALPMGIGDAAALALNKMANESNTAANKISDSLVGAGGRIADQFTKAGAALPKTFSEKYSAIPPLFADLNKQAAALAAKQEEVAAAAAKHAPAIDAATNSTQTLLEKEQEKLAAELASSKAKADAAEKTFAQIEGEIELNAAIASGNEKEVERVKEKQRQAELSQKIKDIEAELPAIIQDIIDKTGTSKEEAEKLANQLVAGRIAAAGAAENSKLIKKPLEDANKEANSVLKAMGDIEHAKLEAAPKRLQERTIAARKDLKDMADFIGEDISKMDLDSILKKLGLDPSDFTTTDQKLTALEGAIQKIGGADPADITPEVDTVGVNDRLEKVKEYLKNAGKEKPDVTPKMDQEAVKKSVDKAKETIEKGLTKSSFNVTLNAEESIGKIREQLKEKIDLAIESSKGAEHLSSIDKLVIKIESLVSKIEGKLPLQALA